MDNIRSGGILQEGTLKAKEDSQNLLEEFDKFVLDLNGDPEADSVNKFRSFLQVQSESLTEHLKILSTIFHISSLFSSHSNLREVLSLIVQSVKEVLNFTRVIILLLNEDQSLLECKIITGMSQDKISRAQTRPLNMDKHDCIETKVARLGGSYLIKDIHDPRLTEIDRKIIRNFERGVTIYVPIISKRGIIGVLGVDRKAPLPPMKPEDVDRVRLFANYIGGLIENAKLYESIIRHRNRFKDIVQQSPNGIIIAEADGNMNLINRAAKRLLGITSSHFLGLPIEKLLGPDLIRKVRNQLSKHDRAQFFDLNFERSDGQTLVLNLAALNIESEDKSEALIIFQDITEKKMIDKHLQRLDKLASIGTMAAGIAHEIRSPLTSISMDLDSLYEAAADKKAVQQTIIQVLKEIERTDKIISNLLQFSRPASRTFTRFDLLSIINEGISLAKRKVGRKEINFETGFPAKTLEITANPDRLKQMMVNLLLNAIESIELKGTIRIDTEMLHEDNEAIGRAVKESFFRKHKGILRIAVEDTGQGISPALKEKVFDPYFTTKGYGTGLGLAIVSKIVEEHQGYVSVSSDPGRSTLFEVFMPANLLAQ